jgi:CheY-like chemotaxis protein
MLEARITSPTGSLYIATEPTTYDVQQLLGHVRGFGTGNANDVRLTLCIGPTTPPNIANLVIALAQRLAGEGVGVSLRDERVAPQATGCSLGSSTHRHEVMLVEDDPDANAALECLLRAHHFEVVVAFDGQQALERLRAGPRPSVILLDVMMPRMDGHAFRAAQRADPAFAAIPVIVFSGGYDVRSIAEQLGARTYLTKPVDAQRLLDAVRRCCFSPLAP